MMIELGNIFSVPKMMVLRRLPYYEKTLMINEIKNIIEFLLGFRMLCSELYITSA